MPCITCSKCIQGRGREEKIEEGEEKRVYYVLTKCQTTKETIIYYVAKNTQ